jgi:hypothetical protein
MSSRPRLGSIRKRLSGRKVNKDKEEDNEQGNQTIEAPDSPGKRRSSSQKPSPGKSPKGHLRRSLSVDASSDPEDEPNGEGSPVRVARPGVFQRLRERSRSRSRSRGRRAGSENQEKRKEMLVAVTSCRSEGYYNQKAPGSTSKLPRKAPTNLKLFHELAVGVKDAYAAVGAMPRKPTADDKAKMELQEFEAMMVLWEFIGNLDFVSLLQVFVRIFLGREEPPFSHRLLSVLLVSL